MPGLTTARSTREGAARTREGLERGGVAAELAAGERGPVYLVRTVGQPQGPGVRPERGEGSVLADPGSAVRLDRLVDHPFGHRRYCDLDGLDLRVRTLVADVVHQPGGLQYQQPGLLDAYPRL